MPPPYYIWSRDSAATLRPPRLERGSVVIVKSASDIFALLPIKRTETKIVFHQTYSISLLPM